MKRLLSTLVICLAVLSCGPARQVSENDNAAIAELLWAFAQTHPEGFTLDINSWEEYDSGIAVGYEATRHMRSRKDIDSVIRHAMAHEGIVGGWYSAANRLYFFDSVRLFPEDSLSAAIKFGRDNRQGSVYVLSSGKEIILEKDSEDLSSTTLIIMYDPKVGKKAILAAIKEYNAEILYNYGIVPGIAIRIPKDTEILAAKAFFEGVEGVISVKRDQVYNLLQHFI